MKILKYIYAHICAPVFKESNNEKLIDQSGYWRKYGWEYMIVLITITLKLGYE